MADEKEFDQASLNNPDGSQVAPVEPSSKNNALRRFYSKPAAQVALVGLVCFLCPGMYNALTGIGGAGQVDASVANKSSIALNATFSVVSFFAGSIHNVLGTKLTLFLGALGYCLYIASFLSYNINQNSGFVVAAGAILGVCASLLWTAQGAVMLSYPTESKKGAYIAIFWIIFNFGAVLGSAMEFGLTYHSDQNTVGNGVYIGFMILTALGACVSAALLNPKKVVRLDGSRVVIAHNTTLVKEFIGLGRVFRSDPWVLLLFPIFLASNWFYTWQFNDFNGTLFTLRTRSLNSLLYWLAQMVGSLAIAQVLDNERMSRRSRAWVGWCIIFVLTWVWGASFHKQLDYTRSDAENGRIRRIDFKDGKRYVGLCFLYIFSGMMDAIWQNVSYWLMGAYSNDLSKLGYLSGFYKSIQSAGAAGAYAMDNDKHPFMTNLAVSWAVCAAGLVFVLPVLMFRITDHTDPCTEKTVAGRQDQVAKAAIEASSSPPVLEKHDHQA